MVEVEIIDKLIINNPYEKPACHWDYDRSERKHFKREGRRPAGYHKSSKSQKFDDPGTFISLEMVDKIRTYVEAWKKSKYSDVTDVTLELLNYWNDPNSRIRRFFFCQLEAIETLIWLVETQKGNEMLKSIKGDGGEFNRLCAKMATGTGKTVVMSMLIAWQALNSSLYPTDIRFSNTILIMAPGITVRERLSVLIPDSYGNYYNEYEIIPDDYKKRLSDANVFIKNWQSIPLETPNYKVVKTMESNFAYTKRLFGYVPESLIVINDEAHHAWRLSDIGDVSSKSPEKKIATEWIGALDRINSANFSNNVINTCYDFSATPYKSTGSTVPEEMMFNWIVSDFGLNDAIESGLVKTPRISVEDDSVRLGKEDRSRLYHIYSDPIVSKDLNLNDNKKELPDLVKNAYYILNNNWEKKKDRWENKKKSGIQIPPVMISICNSTNTADRIEKFLNNEKKTLTKSGHSIRIDSKILKEPTETEQSVEENDDESKNNNTSSHKIKILRQTVNTVGKAGELGEQIWNIVAINMLSEGWDAHNVTHIMGLRAFKSQLLCEQVVGRGLRRMSYNLNKDTGLLNPEYVNIFGIPFTFLPHEKDSENDSGGEDVLTRIYADPKKNEMEINWPNVVGIKNVLNDILKINMNKTNTLKLYSSDMISTVKMAAVIQSKPLNEYTTIELEEIANNEDNRLQRLLFLAARDVFIELDSGWDKNNLSLLAQIVKIVELFIDSNKIQFVDVDDDNQLKKKITLMFNLRKVINHVCNEITLENTKYSRIILDDMNRVLSTGNMRDWNTIKPTFSGKKTHTNLTPYDSKWEQAAASKFDNLKIVKAWIKNDHINFNIKYYKDGEIRDYIPDFIIKFTNSLNMLVEIKGEERDIDKIKHDAAKDWINAVNADGNFGKWEFLVIRSNEKILEEINKILKKYPENNSIATCPACKKTANNTNEIKNKFGHRMVNRRKHVQSWCKKCRAITSTVSVYN